MKLCGFFTVIAAGEGLRKIGGLEGLFWWFMNDWCGVEYGFFGWENVFVSGGKFVGEV